MLCGGTLSFCVFRRIRYFLRAYVLTAALAVHIIHMVATGLYLFGLTGTSFVAYRPQPFPAAAPTTANSRAWIVPLNSLWFRGESSNNGAPDLLVVSPPMESSGVGLSPAGTAITKWVGLEQSFAGTTWGLLIVAISLPPFADLFCILVGFWFLLAGDARQEQLLCMAVAATMPKHLIGKRATVVTAS